MKHYLLPVLLAGLLSACADEPVYPPAPAKAAGVSEWRYILGPGDSINIFVWGHPEVSGTFQIRADGMMTMSLVEELRASDKTPIQLAREIEQALIRYIQDPVVTVTVGGGSTYGGVGMGSSYGGSSSYGSSGSSYGSSYGSYGSGGGGGYGGGGGGGGVGAYSQQIRIIGQATRPQSLNYREGMTLVDVMISVGGLTDFADGNQASILRTVNGKPQQYAVRLKDLVKGGDISANVDMAPGDLLIIPESWF